MVEYDHNQVESKWQKQWKKAGIYQPDLDQARKPFYNLMMFPYPSAEGLHVGNMYAFSGADVYGRFQRMRGYDVFEPIGLDGFGIHSENYAIKIGKHPAQQAKVSQKRYYDQLQAIGAGFAWENRLETYDPDYYRWTQWLFVQMFKHDLAVRKKAMVNWCSSCKTVLADEQVEGGVCERCKTPTERRETEQWFFRITQYADRLLENIEKIDWPEKIKAVQRNWIGKSRGVEVDWATEKGKGVIKTFTTRLDTLFGATFLVLAPEYHLVEKILKGEFRVPEKKVSEIRRYVKASLKKTEQKRKAQEKEKSGVFSGMNAIHPLSGKKVPIWVADFVLLDYGTGAVMGVPAHDARDHDFASQHELEIVKVIDVAGKDVSHEAVEEYGELVNSGDFSGLSSQQAMEEILKQLKAKNSGREEVSYHLRDWLISRQRYWGPPIPMIFCEKCAASGKTFKGSTLKGMEGWWPVAEKDLPVELPEMEKGEVEPKGDGKSPLAKAPESWLNVECPNCGSQARRETDVSDTFLDSSWYFLAYPNLGTKEWKGVPTGKARDSQQANKRGPFNRKRTRKWLPVDAYIGGAEHAVLHLLYSRFVTMALNDWGYLEFEEPFPFLYSHGLIVKDGAKMSKSRGNVVVPDEYIKKYGSDTLRSYLIFLGRYDRGGDFSDSGIRGMYKFLMRVWKIYSLGDKERSKIGRSTSKSLQGPLQRTIKKVGSDIEEFKFNTAIAKMMEFLNSWESGGQLSVKDAEDFIKLLAPFAPHMSEEIWQNMPVKTRKKDGFESIHTSIWPKFDKESAKKKEAEIVVQVDGKMRGKFKMETGEAKDMEAVAKAAKKIKRVAKYLEGKDIKNTIWVEGKLVNFVLD